MSIVGITSHDPENPKNPETSQWSPLVYPEQDSSQLTELELHQSSDL